jgi:hypothetical protein
LLPLLLLLLLLVVMTLTVVCCLEPLAVFLLQAYSAAAAPVPLPCVPHTSGRQQLRCPRAFNIALC